MEWPTYDEQLSTVEISDDILSMIPQELMENSFMMPLCFDNNSGCLTIVTSKYTEAFSDMTSVLMVISEQTPAVKEIKLLSVSYENFAAGYNSHYKQQFTPTMATENSQAEVNVTRITSEQTKLADNILRTGIDVNASDIHITPVKEGPSKVEFRVDGKIRDSGIVLSREDSITVCNIYKRNAGLEVNNLVGQDGRFTFLGRDFRLSTQPYGGDNVRNKVVLRIIGYSNNVIPLDKLSFSPDEIAQLKEIIHKPNGIMLVCGPTGEGKSTTLYSCLQELVDTTNNIIVTVEDPIEKYINGIGQTQVRIAETERNSLTFSKALRSMLRQDPNVIMVGEIRDSETALVAVQASQTGHLILSTLHVRNSISVFRRLGDMGANISGFAEQIVGITSQRLLSLNCPHCRKRVVSPFNSRLRKKDLEKLEWGIDDDGNEGYITYESKGCDKCGHTGFSGRIPLIEILIFNNYLRDYFAEPHGLIDIEKYLRKTLNFKSLWDKGIDHIVDGSLSLEELIDTIEPDVELDDGPVYVGEEDSEHEFGFDDAAPAEESLEEDFEEPVAEQKAEESYGLDNIEKSVALTQASVKESAAMKTESELKSDDVADSAKPELVLNKEGLGFNENSQPVLDSEFEPEGGEKSADSSAEIKYSYDFPDVSVEHSPEEVKKEAEPEVSRDLKSVVFGVQKKPVLAQKPVLEPEKEECKSVSIAFGAVSEPKIGHKDGE